MRRIAIWGTGKSGKSAYENIIAYKNHYEVVAFIDNNKNKWENSLFNCPIGSLKQIEKQYEFDLIVIASVHAGEISEQIALESNKAFVVHWVELQDIGYGSVILEISDICNAKCNWCVTGQKNKKKDLLKEKKYITLDEFKTLYSKLITKEIISKKTALALYSWGEPLLHPQFEEIVKFLHENRQTFEISTNASICKSFSTGNLLEDLKRVAISMPGFSQASYDKIHGFDFNKIKSNITAMVKNYRECGFKGKFSIAYHIYQFSIEELYEAKAFAESLNIEIEPYYAYFNGLSMANSYMNNTMSYKMLKNAGTELELFYIKDYLAKRPINYKCPQQYYLTLDILGNINLCCAADEENENYIIGNIGDIQSVEQLKKIKMQAMDCNTCKECRNFGLDYWANNAKPYKKEETYDCR